MPTPCAAPISRRGFMDAGRRAAAGAAALTILPNPKSARATPASDRIQLAMIGVGGRGNALAKGFLQRQDCVITHVCDVDSKRGRQRIGEYASATGGQRATFVQDLRELLQEPSIDAVVIATPDHWHSLATIWACEAGKDVYVEKPVSHNAWEGRQLLNVARRTERIVQVGTQSRSAPYLMEARRRIEAGELGEVHLCRVYNMKGQPNFKLPADSATPDGLNWDLWNGPAPDRPYNKGIHYQGWHHLWDYSGGDAANDAIHQLDIARWLVGQDAPKSVYCTGGRFGAEGDAQTPDTQAAVYEFENLVMTFDLTLYTPYMLKTDPGVRNNDLFPLWLQNATRIELYGSDAMMIVGRHGGGWQVFTRPISRKPVVKSSRFGRFPDPEHKENFLSCLRTRERPHADVAEGACSDLLFHFANISYRLGGRKLTIDPDDLTIESDPEAMRLYRRSYRAPWVVE